MRDDRDFDEFPEFVLNPVRADHHARGLQMTTENRVDLNLDLRALPLTKQFDFGRARAAGRAAARVRICRLDFRPDAVKSRSNPL